MMWGLLASDVRLTYRSTMTVIYQGEVLIEAFICVLNLSGHLLLNIFPKSSVLIYL